MKSIRRLLLGGLFLLAVGITSAGEGTIEIHGAFEGTIDDAAVGMAFNERAGIWMLQLRSPREFKAKHGVGFNVNLFFSRKFEPAVGTFPILFSYLSKTEGVGGSVLVSGEDRGTFSHDTSGAAVFVSFDDVIEGSFAFEAYEGSGDSRRRIEVSGTFKCPRGKAFQ